MATGAVRYIWCMGERGPIPSDDPSGHRTDEELERRTVTLSEEVIDPGPPDEWWGQEAVQAWYDFWKHYVALAVQEPDLPAIRRLFGYVSLWHEYMERLRLEGPTIEGVNSTVTNPVIRAVATLERQMDMLERQFGIRPLARARLGLKGQQVQEARAKMERRTKRRPGRVVTIDARVEEKTGEPDS